MSQSTKLNPRGVVDKTYYLAMSSKLDYLQKHMSKQERADGKSKKVKKRSNVVILDDDVDWKELVPQPGETSDDQPEEHPGNKPA